ncbi:MAG: LLM class flavin-dependent oxidoreductase [Pseudomonadales bacterium]
MSTELEIGVTAWKFGTAAELAEQGEIAETMGFHSFWLPESHFAGEASIPAPLMLLAAIASRTSRIRLGSSSYLLPIRHPVQAAEEVAVLDRISGGRVILGVGRGYQDAMFTAFEIPAKDKRKQFKKNLEIMISAWQGEPIAFEDGEPVQLGPRPIQVPHPPLWVAAFGPLAIKQAGSLGLPYLASPVETMNTLVRNYQQHRQFAADCDHKPVTAIPVMRTVFISDKPRITKLAKEQLHKEAAHRMREPASDPDQWALIGDRAYVTDKLAEYTEALDITHLIARNRIPGLDKHEHIRSLEQLALIAPNLPRFSRQS